MVAKIRFTANIKILFLIIKIIFKAFSIFFRKKTRL